MCGRMRVRAVLALALAAALLGAAPAPQKRQAALRAILSYAVHAAALQFRTLAPLPQAKAREIFDTCGRTPRERYEPVFAGWPVFGCEESVPGMFRSSAAFAAAVKRASPVAFSRSVPCPRTFFNERFFACARSARGTQIDLAEDTQNATLGPDESTFYLFVLAPPLPRAVQRRRVQHGAQTIRPLLADLAHFAAQPFGTAQTAQFAARHTALIHTCSVQRPPTGRPVLACDLAVLRDFTTPDLIVAARAALPAGFRRAPCVERDYDTYAGLSPVCERGANGVELRFGAGLRIEADDTAYPRDPASDLRSFFVWATAAAARNFRGFDGTEELPYFGRVCGTESDHGEPPVLYCAPSTEAREFDLLALVRRALPPGYTETECTSNVWGFMNPSRAVTGCFKAAGHADIDVGEYQGSWSIYIGNPATP